MKLKAEELKNNWVIFMSYIDTYISEPRKTKLKEFYNKYESRLILYPASNKTDYHNAFPGGYVEHVNRVISLSLKIYKMWEAEGADISGFTREEVVFSALNHDLGKMGNETDEAIIPQDNEWRKNNLGEVYKFNTSIPFASVPDRSLFLLQSNDIKYSFNEMIAILIHDGLYDEANNKYLKTYLPETKPRTCLPYIIHQADMMAARIEFEREWLPKFKSPQVHKKSTPAKSKALKNIKSNNLKKMLNNL